MALPKYTPLSYDGESVLDFSTAMVQAAQALDAAAQLALKLNDVESLTTVAVLWAKIGESLTDAVEEEDEHETPTPQQTLGFHKEHHGEQSNGQPGIHQESRKL